MSHCCSENTTTGRKNSTQLVWDERGPKTRAPLDGQAWKQGMQGRGHLQASRTQGGTGLRTLAPAEMVLCWGNRD